MPIPNGDVTIVCRYNIRMYSFCNLLLSFCCNYFICESRIVSSPKLILYPVVFANNPFFHSS